MTIESILEYLNAVPVRATYGAVGDVLGVRPQAVPRLLGARRREASWIVSSSTGEPTGYPPDQVDPRLQGTHVIRTGDELRRRLESRAATAPDAASTAAPDAASTVAPDAVSTVAPDAVSGSASDGASAVAPDAVSALNAIAGRATLESEPFAMNSDAKWIIGTLVPVVLLVAGLLAAQIASVGGGLHDRIDDVNAGIDALRDDFTAQIADVRARIDEVSAERGDEIGELRNEVLGFADRLRAVEQALGLSDSNAVPAPEGEQTPDPAPAPEADEQTLDPDTLVENPEAQPESPTDPVAPVNDPVPPRE